MIKDFIKDLSNLQKLNIIFKFKSFDEMSQHLEESSDDHIIGEIPAPNLYHNLNILRGDDHWHTNISYHQSDETPLKYDVTEGELTFEDQTIT